MPFEVEGPESRMNALTSIATVPIRLDRQTHVTSNKPPILMFPILKSDCSILRR